MIYVTVGTHLPFTRLIRGIDEMAPGLNEEISAQIGRDEYKPRHITWFDFLPPEQHYSYIERADLVVTHASDGAMLDIAMRAKPAIFMPRRREYREVVNDNQVDFARRLRESNRKIMIVEDVDELKEILMGDRQDIPVPMVGISPQLIEKLREAVIELSARRTRAS
ncbi:MAG: glycosyltransferase [Dehalococcoidia bacterium]